MEASGLGLCDASMPREAATAFEKWAAEKVRHPALPKLAASFQLRRSDSLGVHAVAKSAIATGQVIIAEDALIRLPSPRMASRSILQRYGELEGFLTPAICVDWKSTSQEAREACLTLFYAHPEMERRSCSDSMHSRACEDLLKTSPELRSLGWSSAQLLRFLHIVDLNIHKDDERPANDEFTGIFVLGSKFSHSCEPNSSWNFNQEGHLEYRAIRPIHPGDVLTFSYVGNGMNLITSCLERRRRLAQLCFLCRCARCEGPDLGRTLRCPRCSSQRCEPIYEDQDESRLSAAFARSAAVVDASRWRCGACGAVVAAAELPLEAEEELASLVPRHMQGPPRMAAEDAECLWQLREKAAAVLGEGHWTWFLATFAWLQKCLVRLKTETVVPFGEADLHAASAAAEKWLQNRATMCVEQRLCALFLAARLALHYGEGVRKWGYDPANPLGGELEATWRLEVLGWELHEDATSGPPEPGPSQEQLRELCRRLPDGPAFAGLWQPVA
ncbi:Histone-lysine N-methyltransferase SMYD3 [Symbiodinium microadriaticum]|uniref:Histone-lysine N-methyltransferase SMYD3 n=1 Tax=Symbiodinium microadriaticum TaxID=2951 RepID=A0A1Q9CVI0_SYMMI|nr:Histone-lysine N-methyltransferase SMYD3 [Symbiodinium microadriaticum]